MDENKRRQLADRDPDGEIRNAVEQPAKLSQAEAVCRMMEQ